MRWSWSIALARPELLELAAVDREPALLFLDRFFLR
jgi:hypothetical protein